MTMAIRPVSTIGFIGLSETNTIGYYPRCEGNSTASCLVSRGGGRAKECLHLLSR
jgi:hypothetical protein